tara:strand:+ start:613 stop:789 length:177 start_codon:yes stop_codon:yes gene_type:complete
MNSKQFFSDIEFDNSKSMFDSEGKIIKNHIKWKNYLFQNKNSINNPEKKYLNKYFSLN